MVKLSRTFFAQATKEIFVPPTVATELYLYGDHATARINAQNEYAAMEFKVPHDFAAIKAAEIVVPLLTFVWDYNLETQYGQVGENRANHTEQDLTGSTNPNLLILTALNVASVLTGIAAGDYVGLRIWQRGTSTTDMYVLGLRLRYA